MELEFINHSSFAVRHDGVFLVIDPWLEGRVFNNGWDLLAKTQFQFEDFKDVTHIWFSHEHPDHFFPPNIARIPESYRKQITVLFQATADKRVVKHCVKMGFKEVIEMHPDERIQLSPDFDVLCEHYQEGDSWIHLKSSQFSILNTNDCGIRDKNEAHKIQRKVGAVDVLLTQFSYAYWAGNRDQVEFRRKVADDKLEGLKFQSDIFQPKLLIPMASFVWFCHEENFYLNDEVNRPQKVFDFIRNRTQAQPILLYPGDRYTPYQADPSVSAIERYNADFVRILSGEGLERTKVSDEQEILNQALDFVQNMKKDYGVWTQLLSPTKIYLTDLHQAYELSMAGGMKRIEARESDCDCALSGESLLYNFKFPWGHDTLGINGRYQRPVGGTYSRFYNFFRYNQLKSRGIQVGLGYFSEMALRRLMVKAGLQKI